MYVFEFGFNVAECLKVKQKEKGTNGRNIEKGEILLKKFPDGEFYARVISNIENEDCVVVQSIYNNDEFVKTILILDAVQRSKAKSINLVIPYLTYMRQDKVFLKGEALSAEVILKILKGYADKIFLVNSHIFRNIGEFEYAGIKIYNIDAFAEIAKYFKDLYLFSWDDVPGNNTEFLKFLKDSIKIEWVENAVINKSEYNETIDVIDKNCSSNLITFKLNKVEKKVILNILNENMSEYILKEENGKLNIYTFPKLKNPKVISPDKGAIDVAEKCAKILDCESDYLNKKRDTVTGKVLIEEKDLKIKGKDVLITDDIIASGGTMIEALKIIKEQKPASINLACVHGVFCNNENFLMLRTLADELVATNSIPNKAGKIDLSDLIAEELIKNKTIKI
ncbi:MAG: hypothetical protein BWK75_00905 [Candidatus Altiarchaeales archaeon A3]|nr:MAG: hypothetical protein BWK75_00905 [Candidatus Altiarchaeales archaeon A3]